MSPMADDAITLGGIGDLGSLVYPQSYLWLKYSYTAFVIIMMGLVMGIMET